jgi:DNA-binding transcriptional regulator YiaG
MNWREMTPDQFMGAMAKLQLNQAAMARFLEITARQVRRYERGERPVPGPTALLLRLMIHHGIVPAVPKRPKGRTY